MLKKNNFDSNRTYIVKILLSVFFIVMVLCPLVKMLTYLFQADFGKIVQSKQFVLALKNSLFSTLISTIISVVLAYMLALCVYRTQIKHKTIILLEFRFENMVKKISNKINKKAIKISKL